MAPELELPENMVAYRSWRGVPHAYESRRVFGQRGVESQARVDFARLRQERLAKLQRAIADDGLSALLLMAGDNVRYACAPPEMFWKAGGAPAGWRYALVFPSGPPLLFETVGPDMEVAEMHCPWLTGRVHPAITWVGAEAAFDRQVRLWAAQITQHVRAGGVGPADKIGVDTLDFVSYQVLRDAGVNVVAAGHVPKKARLVKTADELELLKIAAHLTNVCFYRLRHEWVRPGVRECDVVGKVMDFYVSNGCHTTGAIVASGCNANPLFRGYSDKLIEQGDMCIVDIGFVTYLGYGCDYTRCWPVAAPFTPSQKEAYRRCYDALSKAVAVIRPGITTADVARQLPPDADEVHQSGSVLQAAHSQGLGGFDGCLVSRAWSLDYPLPLVKDMYLAVETYCALPDGAAARLEENVVVTESGYETYSSFPFEEEALRA